MNGLIDDFQEITCERDQLFKVFAEKKLKYMDVKDDKTITDKQNRCLKKHVETHESSNLDIKSEILKTTITGKGKGKMRKLRKTLEKSLKRCKSNYIFEKREGEETNYRNFSDKGDLDRANIWTHTSKIVNQLSGEITVRGKELVFCNYATDLCYSCGKLGHPTTKCPVARNYRNKFF